MSRIRDIANLFSANTDAATDAEVASAISSHNTTANGHVKRGNTASRPASPSNGDVYANTETGYFEHYDGTNWTAVGAPASAPSSVVATNQGSGRAYNNGQASVAFSAGTITGSTYTITSSPGSYTSSGASSPLVVTGLQSSTQYTYTVVAANKFGTSSASSASAGVTATTVPQAPTIDSVTAGNTQVTVAFTAGATGGSAITEFTVTSSPGSLTASGASSPLIVTGLTNGTAYTFTAVATNANGTSAASSASSSVTPENPTPIVTGGTLTSDATHYYRTFTSSSSLSISNSALTANILMVSGGGGSGWDAGGGGGGGGLIIANNKSLSVGSYSITIGQGGVSNVSNIGSNGSNTTGFGLTAIGGGGGGYYGNGSPGQPGGSGGGGGDNGAAGGASTQTSGSGYTGYGYAGGSGSGYYNTGAGGGAGGVGSNGGGPGGLPLYSNEFNSTGASIAYSGGGYGNTDSGNIYDTGYNQSNTLVGYYGFGGNGQGLQSQVNSNKYGNPGIVVVKYTKAQVQ